jgi:hypothetical protein
LTDPATLRALGIAPGDLMCLWKNLVSLGIEPPTWRIGDLLSRARILAETGLTASAETSCDKFLAKLASDHRKPNGQFVITPEIGRA